MCRRRGFTIGKGQIPAARDGSAMDPRLDTQRAPMKKRTTKKKKRTIVRRGRETVKWRERGGAAKKSGGYYQTAVARRARVYGRNTRQVEAYFLTVSSSLSSEHCVRDCTTMESRFPGRPKTRAKSPRKRSLAPRESRPRFSTPDRRTGCASRAFHRRRPKPIAHLRPRTGRDNASPGDRRHVGNLRPAKGTFLAARARTPMRFLAESSMQRRKRRRRRGREREIRELLGIYRDVRIQGVPSPKMRGVTSALWPIGDRPEIVKRNVRGETSLVELT